MIEIVRRALTLTTALWLTVASAAWAQTPSEAKPSAAPAVPSLADFFRRSVMSEMHLSPNGRYLATTSSLHGRLNLVVIDLDQRKSRPLTQFDDIDVGRIRWVGNDRLLFSAIRLNAPTGQDAPRAGGLWSIGRENGEVRQLAKTAWQFDRSGTGGFAAMTFLARVPDSENEIIAAAIVANDDSFDLYRVDIDTGRYRLLTQGRPSDRLGTWLLDSRRVPRVAVALAPGDTTESVVYYRGTAEEDWRVIARHDATRRPAFVPLAFDADDRHLLVATNPDDANMGIHRFDPQTGKFVERIAQHPRYDLGATPQGEPLGSLILDPKTRELVGLALDADKPQFVWFDERMAKLQAMFDATFPQRTNTMSRAEEAGRVIVSSYSDTSPGRVFLYDEAKNAIEEIGPARPWLEDGKLAAVRPFLLKTRDGLEIPSYVVLPRSHKPGQRLPTIVHVHGGPMARDVVLGGRYGASFGVIEAQILASRGYAVVLPNFRITPGIGSRIYYAGLGSYGRQMSDDHEDAARWAVEQGFADPKRICISGASYGGYAALHAVSRPDQPFACAISGLPVTDLKFQQDKADYAESRAALEYWRRLLGVRSFDDPLVRQLSPLFNAERIKVPVFMYIGDADVRTPPDQARRMADALKAAGNPVKDFFVGKDEGHGYGVEATNVQLYERMLKFLREALGEP